MIKKTFPIIAAATFSTMLGMGILAPVMPLFVSDMGASGMWLGLIGGGYHVSRAILMPFIGRWSDRRGRKMFLGAGLLLYAGISLLYIFAENLPWLLGVRLFHGLISGMIIPVARAWVGELSPPGEEGRWQGYFNTAFFSGAAGGPILGGFLMDIFNIDIAFAAMGALNLIALLAVVFFLPEPKARQVSQRPSPSFRKLGNNRLFWALFAQRSALELCIATFIFFLPIFAAGTIGLEAKWIGLLLGGALLLTSWLQLLTGRLADKFDRRKLIIIGNLSTFTVIALIPLFPNVAALVLLIFIRSLGGALSMPSASALSVQLGRKFGMGSTIALLGLATSVGMGIGPIAAGPVYDYLGGISSVFYYASGMGLIGLTIFTILSKRALPEKEPAGRTDIPSETGN